MYFSSLMMMTKMCVRPISLGTWHHHIVDVPVSDAAAAPHFTAFFDCSGVNRFGGDVVAQALSQRIDQVNRRRPVKLSEI